MLQRKKICGPLQFNYLSCEEQKTGEMKDNSKSPKKKKQDLELLSNKIKN